MTEQEKNEIMDELEKRMEKKYKGCLSKEDVMSPLKEPRNKCSVTIKEVHYIR